MRNPFEDQETALHFSVKHNFCDMTALLLEKGAIANIQDNNKISPLHYATKKECLICLKLLLNYGASMKVRDCNGYTPLHYAIIFGTCQSLDFLL